MNDYNSTDMKNEKIVKDNKNAGISYYSIQVEHPTGHLAVAVVQTGHRISQR